MPVKRSGRGYRVPSKELARMIDHQTIVDEVHEPMGRFESASHKRKVQFSIDLLIYKIPPETKVDDDLSNKQGGRKIFTYPPRPWHQ